MFNKQCWRKLKKKKLYELVFRLSFLMFYSIGKVVVIVNRIKLLGSLNVRYTDISTKTYYYAGTMTFFSTGSGSQLFISLFKTVCGKKLLSI